MILIEVKFVGVDHWNRPIFKSIKRHVYYKQLSYLFFGSVNNLFNEDTDELMVLANLHETDLEYFGTTFGCEPHGGLRGDIKLKIITKYKTLTT